MKIMFDHLNNVKTASDDRQNYSGAHTARERGRTFELIGSLFHEARKHAVDVLESTANLRQIA
jgi:hypothetical protein